MRAAREEKFEIISTEIETIPAECDIKHTRTKYAWIVLFASFLTQFLNPSLNYAAGVFHVAFLERFQGDVSLTAWIGALYTSMFALAGPVASLVTNMFDCRTCVFASGILGLLGYAASAFVTDMRWLFLTYALTAGLGTAFAQVASVVVLGYYFPQDTALVSGIALTGTALGIFVHPPLVQACIDRYGLTGAFLLAGALVSHSCVLGLLMRPSENELSRKARIKTGRTPNEAILFAIFGGSVRNKSVFLEFSFWIFMISTLIFSMAYSMNILFLPDYMVRQHNASPQESSMVISFIGIGSIISRLCVGALGNDKRAGPEMTYFSIIGITAIISLFLPVFAQGTGGRFAYGLLLGLYTGGVFSLQSTIALQITGIENFALAFGAVMFFMGLGYLTGAPIGGSIYEVTANYNYVFISSSLMLIASSLCGLLSELRRKSRDAVESQEKNEETPRPEETHLTG